MSNLQTIIDQTAFLIERHSEARSECNALFADLLSVIDTRIVKAEKLNEDQESLNKIRSLIASQADELAESSKVDIEFLQEQLTGLEQIAKINNPAQREELLGALLDGEEIKDTVAFKAEILEEIAAAKLSLSAMLGDIKDAVTEGSAEEVAMYLEAILGDETDEDDLEDDEEDEDGCCDDDADGGCCDDDEEDSCGTEGKCTCGKQDGTGGGCGGGCKGCGSSEKGCGTSGLDIFSSLKDYENTQH